MADFCLSVRSEINETFKMEEHRLGEGCTQVKEWYVDRQSCLQYEGYGKPFKMSQTNVLLVTVPRFIQQANSDWNAPLIQTISSPPTLIWVATNIGVGLSIDHIAKVMWSICAVDVVANEIMYWLYKNEGIWEYSGTFIPFC